MVSDASDGSVTVGVFGGNKGKPQTRQTLACSCGRIVGLCEEGHPREFDACSFNKWYGLPVHPISPRAGGLVH